MSIDQALTAPPSTIPDKDEQTPEAFDSAADEYVEWQSTRHYPELITWTSQANALALTVNGYKEDAQEALTDAQEQAELATTNGAVQVSLAADQVTLAADQVSLAAAQAELATTNGAVQVALAADQVTLAQTAASSAALSANVSVYSSGVSYSAGQVVLDPADQYAAYTSQSASNSGHQPSTDSGTYWKPTFRPLPTYEYDDRGDLRSLSAKDRDTAIIDGLGLFVFHAGSDEPDDDESCFATSSGRWLLEAAHWDLVDTWQLPDDAARDEVDEDQTAWNEDQTAWNEDQTARFLYGTATCAITSVAAVTSTSFTGTVTGAAVGDRVYVNPPAMLGTDAASTGRISYHAYVSAANTVTIYLCNASASTATTNTSIRTAWPCLVVKEI